MKLALTALLATLAVACGSPTEASEPDPVLTLDVSSQRLARSTPAPLLSIYSDGRVEMPAVYPHAVDVNGKLSPSELRDLLDFIADEQDFFAIDDPRAKNSGNKARLLPVHTPLVTLTANFDDQQKTISFRALERWKDHVDPRLNAVHARLQRLMAWTQVGGAEGLQPILELANGRLASKAAGTRFSANDLTAGKKRSDGSTYVTFLRDADDRTWSATVELSGSGAASVNVASSGETDAVEQSGNNQSDKQSDQESGDRSGAVQSTHGGPKLTINFNYTDPPGVGFNDAAEGAARRQALEEAAQSLSSIFIVEAPVTVTLGVDGSETNDGILASAAAMFSSAACTPPSFNNDGDVSIIVRGGADPAPGADDGVVAVNFEDPLWDLDDNVAADRIDFKATMVHEFMHAFGFASSINEDGTDFCGRAAGQPGSWEAFDSFMGDSIGFLINDDFELAQDWFVASVGGSGADGLLWLGEEGVSGYGNTPVPLFSPPEWTQGSSASHLDDTVFQGTLAMESEAVLGPYARTLSPIELGILRDIGYNVAFGFDFGSDAEGQWVIDQPGFTGNGQGLTLDYMAFADLLFVAWFTYADAATGDLAAGLDSVGALDNRWLTGQLSIDGNVATGPLFAVTGGAFDAPPQPGQGATEVGTMTIEFTACDRATVSYDIPDASISREFPAVPLETRVNGGFRCVSAGGTQ